MGKTTLALAVAISRHDTVVHWDVNDQAQGWPQTTSDPEQLRRWLEEPQQEKMGNIIIVKPRRGERREQFAQICDIMLPWRDVALICDEASEMMGPGWIDENLDELVRRWNDDSSLVLATHRLRDTNAIVRQNVTDLFLFATNYQPDLKVIEENYSPQIAVATSMLGIHKVCHAWPELGGRWHYSTWDDPSIWYVPLKVPEL